MCVYSFLLRRQNHRKPTEANWCKDLHYGRSTACSGAAPDFCCAPSVLPKPCRRIVVQGVCPIDESYLRRIFSPGDGQTRNARILLRMSVGWTGKVATVCLFSSGIDYILVHVDGDFKRGGRVSVHCTPF